MTIKEMFIETISKALASAEMISDAAQKSEAYASIASALARTGMVRGAEEVTAEATDKEELKVESSKGKKEKKATDKTKIADKPNTDEVKEAEYTKVDDQDTVIPDCNEVAQEGIEDLQVWTDEAQIEFAQEVEYVQQATDYIGAEETAECISLFTNGISSDISFINPANIKGFVIYLECYIKERSAE